MANGLNFGVDDIDTGVDAILPSVGGGSTAGGSTSDIAQTAAQPVMESSVSDVGLSSGTLDILSGVSTGISAWSQMQAADQKAELLEERAKMQEQQYEIRQEKAETQAEVDSLNAQDKQQQINEQLDKSLGKLEASKAASGTVGSTRARRSSIIESASDAKQSITDNLRMGRLARQAQIDQAGIMSEVAPEMTRSRAEEMEISGLNQAVQGLTQFGIQTSQRRIRQKQQRLKQQKSAISQERMMEDRIDFQTDMLNEQKEFQQSILDMRKEMQAEALHGEETDQEIDGNV